MVVEKGGGCGGVEKGTVFKVVRGGGKGAVTADYALPPLPPAHLCKEINLSREKYVNY